MIRRSRTIKPEFFTSADVRSLPIPARFTFLGLLFYVDDYGNESADAALVRAEIWPTDRAITEAKVVDHLLLLAEKQMVTFYSVDGRDYLRVTNWDRHMRVDRPSRSNVPPDPTRERPAASEGGASGEGSRESDEPSEFEGESEGERGRSRASTDLGPAPDPFCPAHRPDGTKQPCKDCGRARLALKRWENARDAE